MALVELMIGGRMHQVACRDGEEPALRALGERLARHADAASRAAGAPSGERMMLFVALMLADELAEAESKSVPTRPNSAPLDAIATRLEALASALEGSATNP